MVKEKDFWTVRSVPGSPSWPLFRGRFLSRYQFVYTHVSGKRVVDVASGAGYGSYLLATKGGAAEVSGVEIDPDAVRYAQEHFQAPNLRFLNSDARSLAEHFAPSSIDTVVSMGTLEHIPEPHRFAAAVRRILKPDGVWLVTMLNPKLHTEPDPFHCQEYDLPQLRQFLGSHFSDIRVLGLEQPARREAAGSLRARAAGWMPAGFKQAVKSALGPKLSWQVSLMGETQKAPEDYRWSEGALNHTIEFFGICRNPVAAGPHDR